MSKEDRREKLKAVCDDFAVMFLYYNRKEDEDLPVGTIEEMVLNGEVTLEEIIDWTITPLRNSLTKKKT